MRGADPGTLRTPSVRALLPAASRPLDKPATAEAPACMFSALARNQPETRPDGPLISTSAHPPSTDSTRTGTPELTGVSTAEVASLSARSSADRLTVAFWAPTPAVYRARLKRP